MLPLDTLLIFFGASLSLALSPGPDNLFVLTQSVVSGRRAGLIVTLGLCTGLVCHTVAVAFGAAASLERSAYGLMVLQWLGALYIVYLAWHLFTAAPVSVSVAATQIRLDLLYRRGFLMNVTNPKVLIFFLAFLPQFTDPREGGVAFQIVILGGVFALATVLVFGAIAWFASALRAGLLCSDAVQTMLNRIAALVFIVLAMRLMLVEL